MSNNLLKIYATRFPDTNIKTIFEIGAHRGGDIKIIREIYPESNIHTFEPDPLNYECLLKNTQSIEKIYNNNVAVCEYVGKTTLKRFHKEIPYGQDVGLNYMYSAQQSIFHCGHGMKMCFNTHNTIEEVPINTITINEYCKNNPIPDIMLLDVQGAEYYVFLGGSEILPKVKCIIFEWAKFPFYEKEIPYDKCKSYLESFGFELISEEYQLSNITGDSLFVNKSI